MGHASGDILSLLLASRRVLSRFIDLNRRELALRARTSNVSVAIPPKIANEVQQAVETATNGAASVLKEVGDAAQKGGWGDVLGGVGMGAQQQAQQTGVETVTVTGGDQIRAQKEQISSTTVGQPVSQRVEPAPTEPKPAPAPVSAPAPTPTPIVAAKPTTPTTPSASLQHQRLEPISTPKQPIQSSSTTTISSQDAEVAAQARPVSNDDSLTNKKPQLRASKIPSTRIGRLFGYGSIVAGVGVGVASEALKRTFGLSETASTSGATASGAGGAGPSRGSSKASLVLTGANVDRVVNGLTRMRGAALKLGQMLSIQDNSMLPPELEAVLLKVQNSANYMPEWQLQKVMKSELGADWQSKYFSHFDPVPIAAASIGQVHRATLLNPPNHPVAVKVQYPGVASSIDSDLDNLKTLLLFGDLLPRGLHLDSTISVARRELAWECDYRREAKAMEGFSRLLEKEKEKEGGEIWRIFNVPRVIEEVTTGQVLTTDFVKGVPIGEVAKMDQETRDLVGTSILRLCLKELLEFRFMQTDPNWSNFLYDPEERKLHLLDFGAARPFSKQFVDTYLRIIHAASINDRDSVISQSLALKFLTGLESPAMTEAHVSSILFLAEPFSVNGPDLYDFSKQDVTTRVRGNLPVMLKERLKPPPTESYSLHRKLSGAFLLCAKLGARVPCKGIFRDFYEGYQFGGPEVEGEEVEGEGVTELKDGGEKLRII
ncbi:hypothetical protein HK102_013242 [Quaeritorhiza haematococci]|nr:hypothetical protein HK102_013242 [Quaeritorhiza haematococci]